MPTAIELANQFQASLVGEASNPFVGLAPLERAKIAEKANAVLKQIAEQRKIDVIVQEAAYVSPKADVTDDVIKALNSQK